MSRANPDLYNLTDDDVCLISQTITSDTDGTGIDLQGYRGVLFVVNVGNSGDTLSGSVYLTLKLEESADDSTYTAVTTAADVIGTTPAAGGIFDTIDAPAEDSKNVLIQYRGNKRYARVTIDVTGTHTNGIPVGVTALKVGSNYLPD